VIRPRPVGNMPVALEPYPVFVHFLPDWGEATARKQPGPVARCAARNGIGCTRGALKAETERPGELLAASLRRL